MLAIVATALPSAALILSTDATLERGSLALASSRGARGRLQQHVHLSVSEMDAVKAKLRKGLLYNKPLTDEGAALVEELVQDHGSVSPDISWSGKFILCSCHALAVH